MKFCCFTAGSGVAPVADQAEFAFFLHATSELRDPEKRFKLSPEDIALLNPNTRTCPIFRFKKDAELTKIIYRRVPVLVNERTERESQKIRLKRLFDMGQTNVASKAKIITDLSEAERESFVKMYEGKMFKMFNHRGSNVKFNPENTTRQAQSEDVTPQQLADPMFSPNPLFWYPDVELNKALEDNSESKWFLVYKNVCSPTNERSMISAIIPRCAANFSVRFAMFSHPERRTAIPLLATVSSFCFDYLLRQSLGGINLADFILKQSPIVAIPEKYEGFNKSRILELSYTSWDLESLAEDFNYLGPPFRWDEDRRFLLRCELDAAFFHFYLGKNEEWHEQGTAELLEAFPNPRDALAYIMETFPIVKRKDEEKYGSYRTKETILEIYDEMAEAMQSGEAYQTPLDPPPGPPTGADGEFLPYESYAENPPPHLHPPKVGAADLSEYQLSDLKQDFPRSPFMLRIGVSADAPTHQIIPCLGRDLQTSDRVLIVHPDLQLSDSKIGAAFGKITINHFRDASTQKPLVVVRVKTTDGRASLRIFPDQWDSLNTVGKIHNEENHHGQTHPQNSS